MRKTLLALLVAACGSSQQAQPVAPTPAPAAEAAPAAPAAESAAAPAAPAAPTRLGPNFTPDGVVFNFDPHGKYKKVYLAGNFNEWDPKDPKSLLTDADGDGIWTITVKLKPGVYQYKFVVDGTWTKDPESPSSNPDGFGGQNGKFEVK